MKLLKYILFIPVALLASCSDDDTPIDKGDVESPENGIYMTVDLNQSAASRVGYEFAYGSGVDAGGNIHATWQLGDILKVYETDVYGRAGAYSDVYHDYAEYNAAFPYPSAPEVDRYYRFICVGGEGTSQGIFKYVGLATATVDENPQSHIHNVIVDIKYDHAIRNWTKFQGLAIYGTPLRNQLMRTQVAKDDMSHLRFGERMYGYVCAHNFQAWFDDSTVSSTGAGAENIVLHNVEGCVYRIIIGGLDVDIYGGSTLSLDMPGITDQSAPRDGAMTLTLGNSDDHHLGLAPWTRAEDADNAFCAYIVGWPGTLAANQEATVTFTEYLSGYTYTWHLSSPSDITFAPCAYYTIDLREHEYTVTK